MKPSRFLYLSTFLSLSILGLAGYLLISSPAPTPAPVSGSAVTNTASTSGPADMSSTPRPAVSESNTPARALPPVRALHTEKAAFAAARSLPQQNTGSATSPAPSIAAGTSAATPDSAATPADADANAPLPVPLPAAIVSGEVPAALPLALVPPDPGTKLNQLQQMGMDSLQQGFIDAVGGPNQDTKDPAYLRRWLDATSKSDALYKTMFGWDAAAQQQARAVQHAGGVKAFFEQRAAAQNLPR